MSSRPVRLPADEDPLVRAASAVIGGPIGRYAAVRTQPWERNPVPTSEPSGSNVVRLPGAETAGRARTWSGWRSSLAEAADVQPRPPRELTIIQRARTGVSVLAWAPIAAVLSLLASGMLGLGVWQKSYCLSNGWGVPEAFWRGCYVDMPYLFANTQLADGAVPYPADGDGALSQPLGTGLMLWLTALPIPPDADELTGQRWYVAIWCVLIAMLLVALVVLTTRTARRDPWRAAHIAASPLLVTVALVSPDLLGVTLAAWGLYLWARERPTAAGIVFGLATVTRTYPLLLVVAICLVSVRTGRLRPALRTSLVTAITSVVLLGLLSIPTQWHVLQPYAAWLSASADYGSIGYLSRVIDREIPVGVVTALAVFGWVAAVLAGAAVALMPKRRPAVAEVCLVIVAIVIVTGKSVPVQTSLWLVPLVALAGVRWRDHLIWAGAEVIYFVAVWLHLGGSYDANRALPVSWYAFFTLLRVAGILYLVWTVVASARARPAARASIDARQAIREDPDDCAGPLAGARDAVVVAIQ